MTRQACLQIEVCVLILVSAVACSCTPCAGDIESSDFVGTWRAEYDGNAVNCWATTVTATGVETLTLRADGSYQQIYDNGRGYVYTSPWNKWHLTRPYGRIHLEGGRFYPLGIEDAEALANGQLFWHTDDDGTGHSLDLDSTTGVFLDVRYDGYILEGRGEMTLEYPLVCIDGFARVTFHRVADPGPIPIFDR